MLAWPTASPGWAGGSATAVNSISSTALSAEPTGRASALRRWGRATFLLEQQSGQIDLAFLRRLLADHYDGTHYAADPARDVAGPVPLCRHALTATGLATGASLVAELTADLGRAHRLVYLRPTLHQCLLPCLPGRRPACGARPPRDGQRGVAGRPHCRIHGYQPGASKMVRETVALVQARFDHEAEEFIAEAMALKQAGPGRRGEPAGRPPHAEPHRAVPGGHALGTGRRPPQRPVRGRNRLLNLPSPRAQSISSLDRALGLLALQSPGLEDSSWGLSCVKEGGSPRVMSNQPRSPREPPRGRPRAPASQRPTTG